MCQPKPGPRCSSHARAAMVAARVTLDGAKRVLVGTDVGSDEAATAQFDVDVAQARFNAAKAEFETTPLGQRTLIDAIDRMRSEGMVVEAGVAEFRLAAAIADREQQVRDLKKARQYAANFEAAASDPGVVAQVEVDREVIGRLAVIVEDTTQATRREVMLSVRGASTDERVAEAKAVQKSAQAELRNAKRAADMFVAAVSHFGPKVSGHLERVPWGEGIPDGMVVRGNQGYNVVAYRSPSAGFTHGQLVPVVEVRQLGNGTKAFRLADQQIVHAWTSGDRSHSPALWIVPGVPGVPVATQSWELVSG